MLAQEIHTVRGKTTMPRLLVSVFSDLCQSIILALKRTISNRCGIYLLITIIIGHLLNQFVDNLTAFVDNLTASAVRNKTDIWNRKGIERYIHGITISCYKDLELEIT